ncbi:MAG: OmpA family protein [Pikeienuella sp.]
MKKLYKLLVIVGLLAPMLGVTAASAQVKTADAIIKELSADNAGPLVRSMGAAAATALPPSNPLPASFDFSRVDLTVQFDGDSHLLTTQGMTVLRSLAAALNDGKLKEGRFQIGAHAVAKGASNASQALSARRAATVVEHLSLFYGVDATRLFPVGYGQSAPIDAANLGNPLNQRITVINFATPAE